MHVRTYSLAIFAELSVQMHAIIPPRASEVHLFSFTEPRLFSLVAGVEGIGGEGGGGGVVGGGGGAEGVAGGGEGVGVQDDDEERVEEIGAGHEGIESGSAGRRNDESRKGRKLYGVSSKKRRKDSMHTANDTMGRYRPLRGPEYTSRGADLGSDSMSVRSRGLSHRQTSTPNSSPTRGRSSRIHPHPPSHYPSHSPSPYSAPTTHRSPSSPPSLPPSLPPSESFDSQPSSQPSSYTSPTSTPQGTYLPTMNSTYQSTVSVNGSADFNSSVWYDEKEKEDTRFNTTNFKDSDVTDYFRTLIGCMQGTYVRDICMQISMS